MRNSSFDRSNECHGRRTRLASIVGGLLSILAASVVSPAARAAPAPFAGIYVTTPPLIAGRPALSPQAYDLPAADGVFIRLVWNAVEPARARFDWTTLDNLLDPAVAAGKKVEIAVITGEFTPAWLFEDGVPGAAFVVGAHRGRTGACRTVELPAAWSAAYQAAYGDLVAALAAHVRTRPGAYGALRIVKITGVNERSEETRMPASNGQFKYASGCAESDAITAWSNLGYRPSKLVQAWAVMAGALGQAFPDKLIALSILQANDFPPIDEAGRVASDESALANSVRDRLIATGLKMFPGRFAVQWNALEPSKVSKAVLTAGPKGAVIGWQANEHAGLNGSDCPMPGQSDTTCTPSSYEALLRYGIQQGGRYIEIWSPDAPRFQDAIARARQSLR